VLHRDHIRESLGSEATGALLILIEAAFWIVRLESSRQTCASSVTRLRSWQRCLWDQPQRFVNAAVSASKCRCSPSPTTCVWADYA